MAKRATEGTRPKVAHPLVGMTKGFLLLEIQMANTFITPTMLTREFLRILHQKLNFVGNVNRDYDGAFAKKGAKIGTSLNIRLPNQFPIRTGASLSTQDITEGYDHSPLRLRRAWTSPSRLSN